MGSIYYQDPIHANNNPNLKIWFTGCLWKMGTFRLSTVLAQERVRTEKTEIVTETIENESKYTSKTKRTIEKTTSTNSNSAETKKYIIKINNNRNQFTNNWTIN